MFLPGLVEVLDVLAGSRSSRGVELVALDRRRTPGRRPRPCRPLSVTLRSNTMANLSPSLDVAREVDLVRRTAPPVLDHRRGGAQRRPRSRRTTPSSRRGRPWSARRVTFFLELSRRRQRAAEGARERSMESRTGRCACDRPISRAGPRATAGRSATAALEGHAGLDVDGVDRALPGRSPPGGRRWGRCRVRSTAFPGSRRDAP